MTYKFLLVICACILSALATVTAQQALTEFTFEQTELSVSLVDIDGDADMDVFLGASSKIYFLENLGDGMYTDKTEEWKDLLPKVEWVDVSMDFTDLDGDGDYDLSILGNESDNHELYMNEGTAEFPIFLKKENSPLDAIDLSALDGSGSVGYTDAVHSWADLDGDGDKDCVVGGKQGWFLYYENIGDAQDPELIQLIDEDNPFNQFRVVGGDEGSGMQYESSPYLIDIDVDGDYDLFSGNQMGTFHFYENVGTATLPVFVERNDRYNPLNEISVAEDSKVAINDHDCDGIWEAYYSGEGDNSLKVEALNRYLVKPIKAVVENDVVTMDSEAIILSGGYPLGGIWSGPGVRDGAFYPSEVGIGHHRITYSVVAFYGCTLSTSEIIEVKPDPYSNPTLPEGVHVQAKSNRVTIENSQNIDLSFLLTDQIGNRIMSQKINDSGDIFFDTRATGVYVINVWTEEKNYSERIFISN